MDQFDGRLILQKTIYILKSFGIDLGYEFNWYRHGVYSPDLTSDGFDLVDVYDDIQEIDMRYASNKTQSHFQNFLNFMSDKKSDADTLELASSICFWDYRKPNKDETIKMVNTVKPYFDITDCDQMWDDLYKYKVVG